MKQGVPVATPGGRGSPALPTPSTPYDLSGVHPGDARHSILEIRMSGSRPSGNRRGLPIPTRPSDSPLANKAEHRPFSSREGAAAGGSGKGSGRKGQKDNGSDTDSDPEFANVSRVLFRAGELIPTSPPSGPRTPARQHHTPGSGGSTRLHPKSPSPSGASGPPAEHQATEDTVGTASTPEDNKLQKAATNSESRDTARDLQHLPQEAAVSGPATSSNEDAVTGPSTRDEFAPADGSNSEIEIRGAGSKRAASRSPSQLEGEEAGNNGPVGEDNPFMEQPNKRIRLDEAATIPADSLSVASTPAALTHTVGLFSSVPLCVDAGALTGRLWCPVNMRNEPDPHWKEFPRNWNHPANPGEGTCHISDLNYSDSSIPEWVHQDHAAHAAQGTLFSSIMGTLAWSHAVIDNCGYDFENDPLKYKIPKTLRRRLEAQPFTFPTTGKNPFMGIVLPFGWGPASDMSLLSRPGSEPSPLSAGMHVPPPLPSTLFSGKRFRNANNEGLKSGSVTPDETPNETPNGTPNETSMKELEKVLVEFPLSVKKKRGDGPAEWGIERRKEVDGMEVDADALGQ